MAELADALALGASGRKAVQVRPLFRAPNEPNGISSLPVDTVPPLQNLRPTCRTSDAILSPYHRCGIASPRRNVVRMYQYVLLCGNTFCHCSQKLAHHQAFVC